MSTELSLNIGSKVVVLIPALNPDENLIEYVIGLQALGFTSIVVIDDGSYGKSKKVFEKLETMNVSIIHHKENKGKGMALKEGMRFALEYFPDRMGVVTACCSGFHTPSDTMRMAKMLVENPDSMILGKRNFDSPSFPSKARTGNKLTSVIFKFLYGEKVYDTQTGLRAFGKQYIKQFLELPGKHYDYEMAMLVEVARKKIPIIEIQIDEEYRISSRERYFRPFMDSFWIYVLLWSYFLKYVASSMTASVIDVILFAIFGKIGFKGLPHAARIYLATICARVISSTYNFLWTKKTVFENESSLKRMITSYYALVIVQMMCSATLVNFLTGCLHSAEIGTKILVDFLLFFVCYQIQRRFVFGGEKVISEDLKNTLKK